MGIQVKTQLDDSDLSLLLKLLLSPEMEVKRKSW
jgi:hypothetical protein